MAIFLSVLVWILLATGGFGLFHYFITTSRLSYSDTPILASVYLFGWSLLIWYIYRNTFRQLSLSLHWIHYLILGLMILLSLATYIFVRKYYSKPSLAESVPHEQFLQLEYPYLFTKLFEILFQQSLFLSLTGLLATQGYDLIWIILLFLGTNIVIHVLQITYSDVHFTLFYTTAATVASVLFPYLYLTTPSGFVYAYILHYMFYIVSGTALWIYEG